MNTWKALESKKKKKREKNRGANKSSRVQVIIRKKKHIKVYYTCNLPESALKKL